MTAGLRVNNIAPVGERPSDLIRGRVGIQVAGVGTVWGSPLAVGPTASGDFYIYDPATDTWTIVNTASFGVAATMVPYHILAAETFTVPLYKQALWETTITIDATGSLVVDGVLIEVT